MWGNGLELVYAADGFSTLVAWVCVLLGLYLAIKRPVANVCLNLCIIGLGGVKLLPGVAFGRVSLFIGLLTAGVVLFRGSTAQATHFSKFLNSKGYFLVTVCLIILFKICAETLLYGFDYSRKTFFTASLMEVVFPVTILVLGLNRFGPQVCVRDLLWGMAVYPVLIALAYAGSILRADLIQTISLSADRFTFGASNTIATARVLYTGAASLLVFLSLDIKRQWWRKMISICLALGLIALLIATGTRQYMFAMVLFLALWLYSFKLVGSSRWLANISVLFCVLFFAVKMSETTTLGERMSMAELQTEADEGRGAIWRRGLDVVLTHPYLGIGFNQFGEEGLVSTEADGLQILRDNAHGLLQDVFTEHGVFLGFAFLFGVIQFIINGILFLKSKYLDKTTKNLLIVMLTLLVPLLFSGGFLNATPLYLLVAFLLALDGRGTRIPTGVRGTK